MSKRSIALANLFKPGAKIDPADLIPPREQGRHLYRIKDLLKDERGFFPGYTEAAEAIKMLNYLYVLDIAIPERKRAMLTDALICVEEAKELLTSAAEAIAKAQQGEKE